MKICMIAYSHYDTDNRIMRYAETLARRGDHVDVIVLRGAGEEPPRVRNGVNVVRVQTRPDGQQSKGSYLWPVLSFFFRSAWLLAKRHRRLHYDIVHVHSVPDFLVFAAVYPRFTGAKVILDIHDILPELYAAKFGVGEQSVVFRALLLVERISARFAHHVIVANDIWRERLVRRSIPAVKCTTILNFPDRTLFHRQVAKSQQDGRFIILYPGSLGQHQGLDLAVRALAKIRTQVPKAELHIYGFGPEKQKLLDLANDLGLGDQFVLRDPLPLAEIVRVMENADLGIVPKRADSFGNEAFSTKTLEFMSLGVPIIVADTAIDRYYFDDSIVRFFSSGDVDALAAAMLELVRDSELRCKLAQNALQFVSHNDWEAKKFIYLGIIEALRPLRMSKTVRSESGAKPVPGGFA